MTAIMPEEENSLPGPSRSPLAVDLQQQCTSLLEDLHYHENSPIMATTSYSISPILLDYASSFNSSSLLRPTLLLDQLAALLSHEVAHEAVTIRFRPLILDLLARWLDETQLSDDEWEARLSILARLAEPLPELWQFISVWIAQSPFHSSPLILVSELELASIPPYRLHRLLLAYWRILLADPFFGTRHAWQLDSLHLLRRQHPDLGVRLLSIQLLSRLRGWSESKRSDMEKLWVGDMEIVDAQIFAGKQLVITSNGMCEEQDVIVDGWMLPVVEDNRVKRLLHALDEESFRRSTKSPSLLNPSDMSPHIACLSEVLLLRRASKSTIRSNLVHVETDAITSATGSIASLLQTGSPVLLSSPPSSGKTHLLHYLSSELHPGIDPTNRILTIPLADTTIDVKSLIGTYVSSPTRPGMFEWMEGALAKAVRAGRWVVFDDIDRASMEMLVTVAGLARSLKVGRSGRRARLAVPGKDDIEAGDGFGLFVTRSTRQDAFTPATFFGHHLFAQVHLDSPTNEDVLAILSAQFAKLPRTVTEAMVEIWRNLRSLAKLGGQVKGRDIGLRDLEKWCARVERNLPPLASLQAFEQSGAGPFANPVFQDEVMLEAADVFLGSLDSKAALTEKRFEMVRTIASSISMDEERAFALLDNRKPQLEVVSSNRTLRIGRTALPTIPSERRKSASSSRQFALTKPSLVLLERIAVAASLGEPALLVGETGTGKTTAVQYIADICHRPLTVLNLSTQTESSDLIGGYKPIDASVSARGIHAKWQKLFCESFSVGKASNSAYLEAAAKALSGRKWGRCADLWATSARRAMDKLTKVDEDIATPQSGADTPRKRRKVVGPKAVKAAVQWQSLLVEIADFDLHHVKMKSKLVFHFVEGPLVKAIQAGEWILLDEVNLASQETLEAIATILEGTAASLVLTERGDVEPVPRHPDFRLFACMNPATDVGKKDLPPNLRARFTEIYSPPPDDDREALVIIVAQYLGNAAAGDKAVILDVAEMYSTLKRLSSSKAIVDGSNIAPHFSMRTLARALSFAVETAPLFGLRRGLWEGCLMAFTMSLDVSSAKKAHAVCERYLLTPLKNARAVLGQIPALPSGVESDDYVRFGPFWLRRGPLPATPESRYVITPSVQAKLSDLARVILTHRYPVLIQGPTSAGKTSAVEFLARQTGHRFVRINNHEHTDIQEYLGTYVTDPQTGNLIFQEGLLVTAVRKGHWIVLDELNLAPTDVLEALNRLLDDNRELIIPETQEVIKPHPNFILFATQNPPGLYAGRKVLSRAFRNRFLEVHFDDVPKDELETILCQRCQIAPSYAKRIVQVFEELRHRRQASRVFESKSSFATLRDLFRWAERGAVGYQQLAEDGFMLLAERARQDEDKTVIKQVIEDVMKVSIDVRGMYNLFGPESDSALTRLPLDVVPKSEMVWTRAMQRLFVLVASALAHNEPVLLVGETGCGKTSVCEVVAHAFRQQLVGVNCHQNMETADLLGSQRPVRNRNERRAQVIATLSEYAPVGSTASDDDDLAVLCDQLLQRPDVDKARLRTCQQEIKLLSALFEWSDGPLVHAMASGDLLLLDEVSLADDSVLERLNSVLEPGRTLVLAEKGGVDIDEATLVADAGFHVVATMNPGGDFGKKELSPALRNRFTEIWVPALNDREDLLQIIASSWTHQQLRPLGSLVLDFFTWFCARIGDSGGLGLRDILAWIKFSDQIYGQGVLDASAAFHHGGQMVFVDGLESLPQIAGMPTSSVSVLRSECLQELSRLASDVSENVEATVPNNLHVSITQDKVSIGGFTIPRGSAEVDSSAFRFEAPSTALNAMRVIRACQLPKAILLEGSPGVGKTSLVAALAAVAGHKLQRINLSDQTDLIDLFGSDLPVEGGQAGEFQWRDAAFLDAMQKGDWVLLDEMNLASQTVLEGLNAVLDHRGTVFIPELGRAFERHPDFRVFAAQNPLQQGGGRKGLPKSFLNRFTKVYLQEHTTEDLLLICQHLNPMSTDIVQRMIAFNEAVREQTMVSKTIGREGSPWEFNLRDLFRWFQLMSAPNGLELLDGPAEFLKLVYLQRFRNDRDRKLVTEIFKRIFDCDVDSIRPTPYITQDWLQIGHSLVPRCGPASMSAVSHDHLELAESVLKSIEVGWLVILAGESGTGKRSLLRGLSEAAGRNLGEFAMHPGVDTSEILGSFEQQDINRLCTLLVRAVSSVVNVAQEDQSPPKVDIAPVEQAVDKFRSTPTDECLQELVAVCNDLLSTLETDFDTSVAVRALQQIVAAGANAVGFTWVDGELLHAIRTGGWFLISDANLCNASVLDRLNSLCETNGVLVMSEKGSASGTPEVIMPHPSFRLFMTYDPRYGELSRAMRNRGVELFVNRPVTHQPSIATAALEDHATMRSTAALASLSGNSPSAIANIAAWQPRSSIAMLQRFAGYLPDDISSMLRVSSSLLRAVGHWLAGEVISTRLPEQFVWQLPADASVNPNIPVRHAEFLFRTLQILVRNSSDMLRISAWLAGPSNAHTVLASSASALIQGGSRRKTLPGQEVYPFTSTIRQNIADQLHQIMQVADRSQQDLPDLLERILVYVQLIEQHSMSPAFDYSSTQLLASWLSLDLASIPALNAAQSKLAGLAKGLAVTSGLGQANIWSLFRSQKASILFDDEIRTVVDGLTDFELRKSVKEALVTIQGQSVADLHDLLSSLPPQQAVSSSDHTWRNDGVSRILELDLISGVLGSAVKSNTIDALLSDGSLSLVDVVEIAKCESPPEGEKSPIFNVIASWMQRMWGLSASDQNLSDPADLFAPVRLQSALRFRNSGAEKVTMLDIPAEQSGFDFAVKSLSWSARHNERVRDEVLAVALRVIVDLFSGLGLFVQESTGHAVQPQDLLKVSATSDGWVHQLIDRHLKSPLLGVATYGSELDSIGDLWVSTAHFLFEAYVTNIPIDPAVRRTLLEEVVDLRATLLDEERSAVEAAEIAIKGVADSNRMRRLQARQSSLTAEKTAFGPRAHRETNAARLAVLFSEVHTFVGETFSQAKMAQLAAAIRSSASQSQQREDSFQQSTAAFAHRLRANFSDFNDLIEPIIFGILCAKFGLRCLARHTELRSTEQSGYLSAALSFPTSRVSSALRAIDGPVKDGVSTQLLLTTAAALQMESREERNVQLPYLSQHLSNLYGMWSATRLQEAEDAQAAESLYRVRKTDMEVLSDQEEEEKEFAELFPTYEDLSVETIAKKVSDRTDISPKFSNPHVAAFHKLVLAVANSSKEPVVNVMRDAIEELLGNSFDHRAFDESFDQHTLAHQVRLLHRRLMEVQVRPEKVNFYLSSNIVEIRKAHSLVFRLASRLDKLIDEWPEQMVLQHIRDRCQQVLALDIRSPVAKMLSALEQLLVHTDDWEGYANRDNSLKSFQTEASDLIVSWRRLELSSWMRLLDDQFEQYIGGDDEWTLRLYGTLIHGASAASDISKHIESTLPMLATYLSSSSIGRFQSRVQVLEAFQSLALELGAQSTGTSQHLLRVSFMLYNVIRNARLFATRVGESLQTQRSVIDKAIKDFVKLASWKDVNVFALKASAQKSHRQLHRSIRKFRDILQQPVAPILSDFNSICPQDPPVSTTQMMKPLVMPLDPDTAAFRASGRASVPHSAPLQRLDETFSKFASILSSTGDDISGNLGTELDEMTVEIIETSAMLARSTPSTLTKDNTKIVNNLAARKRKAYADLLKALRSCGFSQNVRADMLQRQQSTTWMSERPSLDLACLSDVLEPTQVHKLEDYHHRVAILMTGLRAAFNGHNAEIASQDLQRGIGYTESLLATALTQRDGLAKELDAMRQLEATVNRLKACTASVALLGGQTIADRLVASELFVRQLTDALLEVAEGISQLRELEGFSVKEEDLKVSRDMRQIGIAIAGSLASVNSSSRAAGCLLYTPDETDLVTRTIGFARQLSADFKEQLELSPELRHLLEPVAHLASTFDMALVSVSEAAVPDDAWTQSDQLVQALLVVVQDIKVPQVSKDADHTEPTNVPSSLAQQAVLLQSLRIDQIIGRLRDLSDTLSHNLDSTHSSEAARDCIARVLPFVEALTTKYKAVLSERAFAIKSTYKLTYVVGRVMLDLAQKGFCKPSEESEGDKDGADGETVEGTGMGAGTGDKNVSSEIEEEGQVEGLQGETEEQEQDGDKGEDDNDDAMTMENDFEGKMEDGQEREDGEDEGEEDEDEQPDDHVGDVDPLDPGAVDEKFWGDEEQKDEGEDASEDLTQQQTKEQDGEAELSAKEKEDKDTKDPKDNRDNKENSEEVNDEANGDTQHENTETNDNDEPEDDGLQDQNENNEEDQQPAGQDQAEVAMPEGDRLDLPEDLELGDEEEDKNRDELDDDISMDGGDKEKEEENGAEPEDAGVASQDDGEDVDDAPAATGATEEESTELEATLNQDIDISGSNDAQAQESTDLGNGSGGTAEQDRQQDKDADMPEAMEVDEAETQPPGQGSASQQPLGGNSADQAEGDGPVDATGAPIPADQSGPPQSARSLGDIMKDIRRRRDEILAQRERDESAAQPSSNEASGQVEYLQDDQEEDTQALGPAGEEQRQKLEDLNIVDDEMEGEAQGGLEDQDEASDETGALPQRPAESTYKSEGNDGDDRDTSEKALTRADVGINGSGPAADDFADMEIDEGKVETTDKKPDIADEEAIIQLGEVPTSEVTRTAGEDIWRQYASLTSELSYALCEQLRLILEPTLATRLQGDFRTGKRLNMRKIIPYIASEYTKDKIWLRRTKPSRREYQVLLSVDDSRSMAESRSVHLAYQTLALVSQALNKLEVGQVAIARFGDSVDILHPFGQAGFTDADGAKVMDSFKFDQHRTDVVALVDRTLSFLAEARQAQVSSTSAPDLWQLQIIISDGVCQDHERLRVLLRRALEERVMIVFIIVDSLHQQSQSAGSGPGPTNQSTRPSILSMQTVEYKDVGGQMQIEMQRYLDTFPFEFYVVLRDVEALPGVLADTLRQWMARVSQSQE
ncbi:hypothetical protein BCR39DRAFT_598381 [Naematelia encephala]|uniref:Midasin n=1 Tax=Naematelia encephala TaxID=71784 RepID=A0A1Y2B681_9TREE|nr:hypothetical protein BCR39DRAFT_598381 [Naematelia encephala]